MFLFAIKKTGGVWLALSVERVTLDLGLVGLNPVLCMDRYCLKIKINLKEVHTIFINFTICLYCAVPVLHVNRR